MVTRSMRRSLTFDVVLLVVMVVVWFVADGALRTGAGLLAFLALAWLPYDLLTERRRADSDE